VRCASFKEGNTGKPYSEFFYANLHMIFSYTGVHDGNPACYTTLHTFRMNRRLN